MNLSIIGKTPVGDREYYEKVAQATFSYLKATKAMGEIELKFVSKQVIQELNRTYRGIDKPTDVLSFNISEKPLVGQLFICYTYAKVEAKKNGKTSLDEVSLLLVHGILHVFGFDHAVGTDEQQMIIMETNILNKIGIKR